MAYLLDTRAISEPTKENPHPGVVAFLQGLRTTDGFISVVTVAEVSKGIELLAPSKRRKSLEKWFETELLDRFDGRILAIDVAVAMRHGAVAALTISAGKTMPRQDSYIAATALVHGLTVVTRNTPDFVRSGVLVFDPWK